MRYKDRYNTDKLCKEIMDGCEEAGITLKELVRLSYGYSTATERRIKEGMLMPSASKLVDICAALGWERRDYWVCIQILFGELMESCDSNVCKSIDRYKRQYERWGL